MNRTGFLALAFVLCATPSTFAQTPLDQAITARYPLTKATADRSDIVTAGTVFTLKKDGLLTFGTSANAKSQLTYKDGKFNASGMTKMTGFSFHGQGNTGLAKHTFVAGEKLFLIDERTNDDGVTLTLLSDAISDVRYIAFVKFPFPKGAQPAPSVILGTISEAMDSGDAPAAAAAAAPAPAAPAPAPMAAIPPPPPPPDQPAAPPPTLDKGMTKDQVVAGFGPPVKVVKMGTKEIDYYKDMKVTYTAGKVSNVE